MLPHLERQFETLDDGKEKGERIGIASPIVTRENGMLHLISWCLVIGFFTTFFYSNNQN